MGGALPVFLHCKMPGGGCNLFVNRAVAAGCIPVVVREQPFV
jgi:hypothetical protein